MIDLPAWFYSIAFPAIALVVGWLFGWKLTRNGMSKLFRRK